MDNLITKDTTKNSREINFLKQENYILREALNELKERMENNEVCKPKSCQYCKYFVQYYIKGGFPVHTTKYVPIDKGHCMRGVPIKRGGIKNPTPGDTCPYFEMGTLNMGMCL